jgi:hypothetical protein
MCGWGITSTAIAAQLPFNQELCGQAERALVTFTAISARLRREHFHGNVRKGDSSKVQLLCNCVVIESFVFAPEAHW